MSAENKLCYCEETAVHVRRCMSVSEARSVCHESVEPVVLRSISLPTHAGKRRVRQFNLKNLAFKAI